MYCQVLIASTDKEFIGIKGLDRLQAIVDAKPFRESLMNQNHHEEEEEKVTQWLQTACIGWMNRTKQLEQIQKDKEQEEKPSSPVSPKNTDKANHVRNRSIERN